MKKCNVCDKEVYKNLDYCESCAEALCIIAEGVAIDQNARRTIALDEEEAVYRLRLLIEEGWHNEDNCERAPRGEDA